MRNWYTMKVKEAEDDEDDDDEDKKKNPFAEIVIYDAIGQSFFDDQAVSAKQFIDALNAIDPKVEDIRLRINSPGGDVFDGVAIYNALKNHKAKITAHVDGIAASIASVIAMAADKIIMPSNAFMLVHNSQGFSMGTAEEMHALAADLERIDKSITATYSARTGTSAAKVRALMKEDRLMDAKEAKELGFADEVSSPVKMAARMNLRLLPKAIAAVFAAETGIVQGEPPHSASTSQEPAGQPSVPPVPPEPLPPAPEQPKREPGSNEPRLPPDPFATPGTRDNPKPGAEVVDLNAARQQGIEDHRAYVTAVTDLCTLARAPERIAAFIRANATVEQVRKDLLAGVAENPVLSQHPLRTKLVPAAAWGKITDELNARKK